jgi:hypothetical protein
MTVLIALQARITRDLDALRTGARPPPKIFGDRLAQPPAGMNHRLRQARGG